MRILVATLAGLLCGALACGEGRAQVSFDPRALAPLQTPAAQPAPAPGPAPAASTPATSPPPEGKAPAARPAPARREPQRAAPSRGSGSAAAPERGTAQTRPDAGRPAPATPGRPGQPAPARPPEQRALPTAPPPPVALPPPPIVVPARPPPPPSPVTVASDAPGEVAPIPGGSRISFGTGRSDLNPATDAAIKAIAHAARAADTTTFTVVAYAAGTPEDPSTARRLSLARALAVRSVLIVEGVPSVRIYVKALGAPAADDAPADRVEITVATPPAPPPATMPPAAAPPAPTPGPAAAPTPSPATPPPNQARPAASPARAARAAPGASGRAP